MKKKVKKLIEEDHLEFALDLLIPYSDIAILLKSQLNGAKRDFQMGILDYDAYKRERNRIKTTLLSLVNELNLPILDPSEDEPTIDSSTTPSVPKLFFSYSHDDLAYLQDFLTIIKPLERAGKIEIWADIQILPGQSWNKLIIDKIHQANIIVMLISPDFLASSYIWEKELKIAVERHNRKEVTIFPVVLRDCLWQVTFLSELQMLPLHNGKLKALNKWEYLDEAWAEVAKGILKIIDL